MSRFVFSLLAACFMILVQMGVQPAWAGEFAIDPGVRSTQISAVDSAESAWFDGRWHMREVPSGGFFVNADAGFFGPAFLQFQLEGVSGAVSSASLVVTVTSNNERSLSLVLSDVVDEAAVLPPASLGTLEEFMASWAAVKTDLMSGRQYGATDVPGSDTAQAPFQLEITLSDDAVDDINARIIGGLPTFGIGLGPGSGWGGEGESIGFSGAELRLTTVSTPVPLLSPPMLFGLVVLVGGSGILGIRSRRHV